MKCAVCPRGCSGKSFCGGPENLRLALAALHFGEEPPITGKGGSGTLFFSGCNMQCPFCQNWQISRSKIGKTITTDLLSDLMLELKNQGAENINFVTGTHFSKSIIKAAELAKEKGLDLPLLWNSSAYEDKQTLKQLSQHIKIWLPDLKTLHRETASKQYACPDYPEAAMKALNFMMEQNPIGYSSKGTLLSGTVIRHLILPDNMESTRTVLEWYAKQDKNRALLSLLSQYTPVQIPGEKKAIPNSYLSEEQYNLVLQWLDELDINDGFIQELETGSDWLPDFRETRPFSSSLARVIWTAGKGLL